MRKRDTLYREIHRQISGAAAHDRSSERALSWAVNVLRFDDRGGTPFRLGRGGESGGGRRILLCVPVYVLRARSLLTLREWEIDLIFVSVIFFTAARQAILSHVDNSSIVLDGILISPGPAKEDIKVSMSIHDSLYFVDEWLYFIDALSFLFAFVRSKIITFFNTKLIFNCPIDTEVSDVNVIDESAQKVTGYVRERGRDESGCSCGVARSYACALLRPYIISRRYKCLYVCKIPSSGRVEP